MERDIETQDDPEAELRRRIGGQVAADVPDPVSSPVYDDPPPMPAPPPSGQGITDPSPRSVQPDTPPPPPANSGGSQSMSAAVANFYRNALGREGSPDDIQAWINGTGGNLGAIQQGIYGSPEAQAYSARQSQAAPAPTPGATNPGVANQTPQDFIRQYQQANLGNVAIAPLLEAMKAKGYDVSRFMYGSTPSNNELVIGGQKYKVIGAENGPNAFWYTGGDDSAPAPRQTFGASIAAPAGAPTPTGSTSLFGQSGPAPQGVWTSPFLQQIRAFLMDRMGQASQPVDPNDPSITAPLTAARDEATRGSDRERTQLAEHLYAEGGLNTDAISQKIQQSGEKNATGLASLRATLITRELQSKRDELKSLLAMAIQSGDAESAQAIQMQLAELQAAVQREGLGVDMAKYQAYLNALGSEQVMN